MVGNFRSELNLEKKFVLPRNCALFSNTDGCTWKAWKYMFIGIVLVFIVIDAFELHTVPTGFLRVICV